MKWLFAALLVINILFFAIMQSVNRHGAEPAGTHEPVKAEKIRLLPEIPAPTSVALAMSPMQERPEVCLEWGVFSGDLLKRAEQALEKLQLGDKLIRAKSEKTNGHWVYISPRKSLEDAMKKTDELKRLGVKESFVIREGSKWQFAISLGIFSSKEGADKYLEQLREKGVKSAISGPHVQEGGGTMFQINDASNGMSEALAKIKLDFPGSELKAVECRKPVAEGQ